MAGDVLPRPLSTPARRQLTERLGIHQPKIVHSAPRQRGYGCCEIPSAWASTKMFILPPVYSACLAAAQRLGSTRSGGISPQAAHSGVWEGVTSPPWERYSSRQSSSFVSWCYMLIFLNRKYSVDSKSEEGICSSSFISVAKSVLAWQIVSSNTLQLTVITPGFFLHVLQANNSNPSTQYFTSNSLLRGYSSYTQYML